MARTMRDIQIVGRSGQDVVNEIYSWASSRHKIEQTSPNGFRVMVQERGVELAATVATHWLPRIIDVSINPMPNGVVVHTEGYVKSLGAEYDLKPGALSAGLPRKTTRLAIEDLWRRLEAMSVGGGAQPGAPPPQSYIPPPPQPPPQVYSQPPSPTPSSAPAPGRMEPVPGTQHSTPPACGRCGAIMKPGTSFCISCGEPSAVVWQSTPAPSPPTPAAEPTPGTSMSTVQPQDSAKFCSNCGSSVKAEHAFCTGCGQPLRR